MENLFDLQKLLGFFMFFYESNFKTFAWLPINFRIIFQSYKKTKD